MKFVTYVLKYLHVNDNNLFHGEFYRKVFYKIVFLKKSTKTRFHSKIIYIVLLNFVSCFNSIFLYFIHCTFPNINRVIPRQNTSLKYRNNKKLI